MYLYVVVTYSHRLAEGTINKYDTQKVVILTNSYVHIEVLVCMYCTLHTQRYVVRTELRILARRALREHRTTARVRQASAPSFTNIKTNGPR